MDNAALIRLMTWLSPAFPVGAFSYSHGIERAVHDAAISDKKSLQIWLEDLLHHGSIWNDAVLFAAAWRTGDAAELDAIAQLGEAMAGSSERHMETMLQGDAFIKAAGHWAGSDTLEAANNRPYPIAVAIIASRNGIDLEPALAAYLHALVSNLIQGAVRLIPLGQSHGVAVLAAMEGPILGTAGRAAASSLDDLGSAAIMSEIMAMQHEVQYSRVFRS